MSYLNIAESKKYYKNKGFIEIEVPWYVDPDVSSLTRREGHTDVILKLNNKVLIASAEQGFVQMAKEGRLPTGLLQATTPCFRNDTEDALHQKCFVKNELIWTEDVNPKKLDEILNESLNYFSTKFEDSKKYLFLKRTKEGYDINYKNINVEIELGSYGIRSCEYLNWIFATGCAEPRLSTVIQIHDEYLKKILSDKEASLLKKKRFWQKIGLK